MAIGIALGVLLLYLWAKSAPNGDSTTTWMTRVPSSHAPTPTTSPLVFYPNCAAVRAAGKAPLHEGSPGYRPDLDHNGAGAACEGRSNLALRSMLSHEYGSPGVIPVGLFAGAGVLTLVT